MDGLPGEVIIKFNYSLNCSNKIESKLLTTKDHKLLAVIEGRLEILIDNKCFFLEDSVLLMELAVQLYKWSILKRKDIINDFEYLSMSHTAEPLLKIYKGFSNMWFMDSPWKEFNNEKGFFLNDIILAIDLFLKSISSTLKRIYNIDIYDFC